MTFENLHIQADEPACSHKGSSLWQNHTPSGYPWGHLWLHCLAQMLYFLLTGGGEYHGNGWLFDADWISISVLQGHPKREYMFAAHVHVITQSQLTETPCLELQQTFYTMYSLSVFSYSPFIMKIGPCENWRLACKQARGLEEHSKFIGRRKAPATRYPTVWVIPEQEACSQANRRYSLSPSFNAIFSLLPSLFSSSLMEEE